MAQRKPRNPAPAPPLRPPPSPPWPSDPGAIVLEALRRARDQGGVPSDAARLVLHARDLHSRARRRAADELFDLARLAARLDARIRHALPKGRLTPTERDTLRVAAYRAGERHDPPPTVAMALNMDEEIVAALASGAFLEGLVGPDRLAVAHAMPGWLTSALCDHLGQVDADRLLQALNVRAPLCLRAARSRDALLQELHALGLPATPTPFSPLGVLLHSHPNARSLPPFQAGRCEVQDEGSQLIAVAVAPRPGELVVDGCAGAGGKTLALAALEPRARLVAVEPDGSRLDELVRRARRAGVRVEAIHAALGDPATRHLWARADAVLLDVPCSGTGALRREPQNRWRYTPKDIQRFSAEQLRLARLGRHLARPGGRLAYATCSLLRAEDEEVTSLWQAADPGLEPLPLEHALGQDLAGRLHTAGHELRLLPHLHGTDGFYVATFRVQEPSVSPPRV